MAPEKLREVSHPDFKPSDQVHYLNHIFIIIGHGEFVDFFFFFFSKGYSALSCADFWCL